MITDNDLNYKILDEQYNLFTQFLFDDEGVEFKNFKHPYIEQFENYKYAVKNLAKEKLQLKSWNENSIGKGEILQKVISSIEIKEKKVLNNLLQWDNRFGPKAKEHLLFIEALESRNNLYSFEKLFYDFFTNKSTDEDIFKRFTDITTNYRLISYFYFVKLENKMPLVPTKFDKIFELLGINFKTTGNCNYDNYLDYNEIIKLIKKYFINEKNIKNTELLDAHSFLWIIGPHIRFQKEKEEKENSNRKIREQKNFEQIEKQNRLNEIADNKRRKEEVEKNEERIEAQQRIFYQTMTDEQFIEIYKKQMENGHSAEVIIFENEKKLLRQIGRDDLAQDVQIVGNMIGLGYDILSFEPIEGIDRIEKQIEVKSVQNTKIKRFYLTRNELEKSRNLSNYYVYLVDNSNIDSPIVTIIKNPNFFDKEKFELKTSVYEIKFDTNKQIIK